MRPIATIVVGSVLCMACHKPPPSPDPASTSMRIASAPDPAEYGPRPPKLADLVSPELKEHVANPLFECRGKQPPFGSGSRTLYRMATTGVPHARVMEQATALCDELTIESLVLVTKGELVWYARRWDSARATNVLRRLDRQPEDALRGCRGTRTPPEGDSYRSQVYFDIEKVSRLMEFADAACSITSTGATVEAISGPPNPLRPTGALMIVTGLRTDTDAVCGYLHSQGEALHDCKTPEEEAAEDQLASEADGG